CCEAARIHEVSATTRAKAQEQANGRRSRSRRHRRFDAGDWNLVETLLREDWSPEQVAGSLQKSGELSISHATIYRYGWADRAAGGARLAAKRTAPEPPAAALRRQAVGHWEIDTVMGTGNDHCIVMLVERA